MKKALYMITIVAMAASYTSCEKAAALLFQPFESPLKFNMPIDPVMAGVQSSLGTSVVSYNLDAEVRGATSNSFGADFITQVYVKEIAISLSNADAANDLGNFQTLAITLNDGVSNPVVIGPFDIPATTEASIVIPVPNSPNLRQFFNGSNVAFTVSGLARTATSKTLQAAVSATIKIDK